jgi:hypothetical protein
MDKELRRLGSARIGWSVGIVAMSKGTLLAVIATPTRTKIFKTFTSRTSAIVAPAVQRATRVVNRLCACLPGLGFAGMEMLR